MFWTEYNRDKSTPTERKWLDRLQAVRPDMNHNGGLVIRERTGPKTGQFNGVCRVLKIYKTIPDMWGIYLINLKWIKREVYRLEKEQKIEYAKECTNCIGSGI